MASILADIGTKVGQELKTLDTRLTSAEAEIVFLGGQTPPPTGNLTVNPVQWTNLTEINLSGEKAQNISFDPPPLAVGVEVEILTSWTDSGNTALVGQVYTIDSVRNNGGLKLVGNGQTIFSSADQAQNNVIALHPLELNSSYALPIGSDPPPNGSGWEEFVIDLQVKWVGASTNNHTQGYVYQANAYRPAWTSYSGSIRIKNDSDNYGWVGNYRGTDWEVVTRAPYLWTVANGTLDQDKLAQGIIKGFNASAGVQQMFTTPLAVGTKVVVKVERSDINSGTVAFKHVKLDGNTRGGDVHIPRDDGFVEYTVTDADMHGIRFTTMFGQREITSVSVFQGEVSGGTVQANGNGGIEKIAGANGYNAGASSTNFIEGNSNGYVQFQIAQSPLRVGLTYEDVDFENIEPFRLVLNYNGSAIVGNVQALASGTVAVGDFFRIRHYASDNTIRFQKRENIYNSITLDFANLAQNSSSKPDTHVFEESDRPYVRGVNTEGGFVEGTIYRMYESSTTTLRGRIYTLDGTDLGFSNAGTKWEVVELVGTDYVTFYTHPELTNGNDLYVDTSLYGIGSRLNDVLLAR